MSDDAVDRMLDDKPLIGFSIYTARQVDTLNETAQAIVSLLDSPIESGSIHAVGFHRAHGLFWLWVLGAYEVARTMCQARRCFSDSAGDKICDLKRRLTKLRIPFAKQEYARAKKRKPIQAEGSVTDLGMSVKDVSFEVEGTTFSIRRTMDDFRATIADIRRADVLHDHRSSYNRPASQSLDDLSTILTGVAGEYFVAAELSRRGYVASVTLRNTRGMDVIATNADASRSVGISVKTNRARKKDWMVNAKAEGFFSDTLFYVFVNLNGVGECPSFHVVPSKTVADSVYASHRDWLSRRKKSGDPRKDSSMRRFKDLENKYLDRWDLLGLGVATQAAADEQGR